MIHAVMVEQVKMLMNAQWRMMPWMRQEMCSCHVRGSPVMGSMKGLDLLRFMLSEMPVEECCGFPDFFSDVVNFRFDASHCVGQRPLWNDDIFTSSVAL